MESWKGIVGGGNSMGSFGTTRLLHEQSPDVVTWRGTQRHTVATDPRALSAEPRSWT